MCISVGGGRRTLSGGLDSKLFDSSLTGERGPVFAGAFFPSDDNEEIEFSKVSEETISDSSIFNVRIRSFCETLSPAFNFKSFTVPENGEGTSIEALSLSIVINGSSKAIVSPDLTNTSITSTISKSPMSGTVTSFILLMRFLFRTLMDYLF